MAYVSDSNLTQFWGLAKNHIKAEDGRFANWQKTEKASAVTCWPVGGTELLPTVDFMFTETPPASGDKGPDNPSTISGVSDVNVKRFGKNCCVLQPIQSSEYVNFAVNQDGTIRVYGTVPSSSAGEFIVLYGPGTLLINDYFRKGEMYTASFDSTDSKMKLALYSHDGINYHLLGSILSGQKVSFTLPSNNIYRGVIRIACDRINNVATEYDGVCKIQIELGSQATSMDLPAVVDSHTIPLGSTYYGGTLDVATGVMTVTHVAVTPEASTVDISSAPAAIPLDYADTYGRTITSADGTSLVVGSTGGTVVYKLATPQTVQLAPTEILSLTQPDKYTPRLNTVYTDASAVQVGYVKSPIRSEYELTQAIIATEGGE